MAEQIDAKMDPTAFTYHTTHRVICGGKDYPAGSEFRHDDPAIIAELRKAGAIALREELERPDAIAARQAEIEAENAALRAEVERLRAQGATLEAASAAKAASAANAASAIKGAKAAAQPAAAAAAEPPASE